LIISTETPGLVLAQARGIVPHPAIDVVAPRIHPEKFQLPGNVLCVLTNQDGVPEGRRNPARDTIHKVEFEAAVNGLLPRVELILETQ
jgi:hypothetical protein